MKAIDTTHTTIRETQVDAVPAVQLVRDAANKLRAEQRQREQDMVNEALRAKQANEARGR